MNERTDNIHIRIAPTEKKRLQELASSKRMNSSQVMRSLIVCALREDYPEEIGYSAIVFDRETAPRMAREMKVWGYHYNQAVHALNRLAYYAQRGSLNDGEAERLLCKANKNLEEVGVAARKLKNSVDEMVEHALVSV